MGSKEEELRAYACLRGHGLPGLVETLWDCSYEWSIELEDFRLWGKEGVEARRGLAVCVSEPVESTEVFVG